MNCQSLFKFYISSFLLSCSFNTLFTKTSSSGLIYELIKDLEINTSMLLDLVCADNTILSCFFFFFLIIDLYIDLQLMDKFTVHTNYT